MQGGLRLGALAEEVLQAEHAQVEGEDDIYTGQLYFYRIQRDRIPVIKESILCRKLSRYIDLVLFNRFFITFS